MKQTAVEFLIEQFQIPNSDSYISKTFQQAIEMEKQQIENAYDHCRCIGNFDSGTEYYNETYKPSA
jgi:hypothetical protein